MNDEGMWFEPKLYGIGAGMPIRWQGWAALGILVAATAGLSFAVPPSRHPVVGGAGILILVAGFSVVAAQHTKGGWRWRWGGD